MQIVVFISIWKRKITIIKLGKTEEEPNWNHKRHNYMIKIQGVVVRRGKRCLLINRGRIEEIKDRISSR
jgi:hypothetical protein